MGVTTFFLHDKTIAAINVTSGKIFPVCINVISLLNGSGKTLLC